MWTHSEKRHHSTVKQVCHFAFHLHVDILNEHTVYDSNCLEIDIVDLKLLLVSLDIINLFREGDVIVALVSGSLALEAPDALFDIHLDPSELLYWLFYCALDLSGYSIMELLVLVDKLILKFSDLNFDHFVGFGNLEVGDLGAERLDFFSDLLDQLSPIGSFELSWARCHYLHCALSSFSSFTCCCCCYWGQLAVGLDNHLLAIRSCYDLLSVRVHSFIEATWGCLSLEVWSVASATLSFILLLLLEPGASKRVSDRLSHDVLLQSVWQAIAHLLN